MLFNPFPWLSEFEINLCFGLLRLQLALDMIDNINELGGWHQP